MSAALSRTRWADFTFRDLASAVAHNTPSCLRRARLISRRHISTLASQRNLPTLGRAVFERYYRELLNFLSKRVGDRELAADLAQESFARVYGALGRQGVPEPRALLFTTARNLLTDHYRRSKVRGEVAPWVLDASACDLSDTESFLGPSSWEPDTILAGRQRLAAIERAVSELPPRPREAFVLYKLEGLSRAEVAERMGVSLKTVETHLEIAMQACVRRLQALEGAGRRRGQGCAEGRCSCTKEAAASRMSSPTLWFPRRTPPACRGLARLQAQERFRFHDAHRSS